MLAVGVVSLSKPVTTIALTFLVFKMTGVASSISLTLGLSYLPFLAIPFIGTYVERVQLKFPMIMSCVLSGLFLAGLVLMLKINVGNIFVVYIFSFLIGLSNIIFLPAEQKLIPAFISHDQLEKGNGFLSATNQCLSLVGFSIGGIVVVWVGPSTALIFEAIGYLFIIPLLVFIRFPRLACRIKTSFIREFVEGIDYIFNAKIVFVLAIMLSILNVIAAPFSVLLPVYIKNMGYGAEGYGIFMSILLMGGVFGAISQFLIGDCFKSKEVLMVCWLSLAAIFVGFSELHGFYFCLFWAFLIGFFECVLDVCIMTVLQKIIPEVLRARILGSFITISLSGLPLTFLILSLFIRDISLFDMFIALAIVAFLFSFVSCFFLPEINFSRLVGENKFP